MKANQLVDSLLEHISADGANTGNDGGQRHQLGDIFAALPAGVDQQCIDIMNQENDTIAMAKKLKAVLAPHAAALDKVGVVADYLAYMLVHVAQQQRGLQ